MVALQSLGGGLLESLGQLATLAGALLLLLMLVALGSFAYKQLTGGVEWPDEDEEVTAGDEDDEWDYY
jgi:hypothetical protein